MSYLKRNRIFTFTLACAVILISCVFHAYAQDQDESVRGAFLTSRPAGTSGTAPRKRRRRHRRISTQSGGSVTESNTAESTNSNSASEKGSDAGKPGATSSASASGPIGVGYSLYLRNSRGEAMRVDPSRQFHANDSIRITVESNTDGYLYVFHTENGSSPEMIFPDPRLSGGDNEIDAHVPVDVPSSRETEERFRWFTFDKNPATESIFMVVTREPLSDVPIEDDLIKYCGTSGAICPWRPTPAVWANVKSNVNKDTVVSKSRSFGQSETASEREALSRGLGLDRSAPSPSVIRMSATSTAPALVTTLDLTHN